MKAICDAIVFSCSSFNFKNDKGEIIEGGEICAVLNEKVSGDNNDGLQSIVLKLNSENVTFADSLMGNLPCKCELTIDIEKVND